MPRLIVLDPEKVDAVAAEDLLLRMRRCVSERGKVVVTLPFGRTPTRLYALWRAARDVDWSQVVFVSGDEYLGAGRDDPDSGSAYLMSHLLGPLLSEGASQCRLRDSHVRLLDGAREPMAELEAHEAFIAGHGGVDIALLGVGAGPAWSLYRSYRWLGQIPGGASVVAALASVSSSPHLWFNERHSSFASRSRVVELTAHTRRVNASTLQSALTIGLQNVTEARQIVALIKGARKRSALDLLLHGPVSERIPLSVLARADVAPKVTIYADTKAAG
jgi:glucosamine-6-phosphate deaminase